MLIISGNYVASAEVYLGASRVPSGVSGLPGLSKKKLRTFYFKKVTVR